MDPDQIVLRIIVGDPERGVRPALETGWLAQAQTVVLPPVVMRRGTEEWRQRVDEERFLARFGRPPLESEMGCAAAHLSAYEFLLSSTAGWALVLEDDALISNGHDLQEIVNRVVRNIDPIGYVVSLYTEGPLFTASVEASSSRTLRELSLAPEGAVAYLIDRTAAAELLRAQRPIASVSDWPPSERRINYCYVVNDAVGHATETTKSTVAQDVDRSRLVPRRNRILMWTGVWYLLHRQNFDGPRDYATQVLYPRLVRRFRRRD